MKRNTWTRLEDRGEKFKKRRRKKRMMTMKIMTEGEEGEEEKEVDTEIKTEEGR